MVQDGPTNTGYGTTNADAGEGIGMLKGIRKNIKKAINSHTYVLWWAIIPKSCLCKEPTYVRKNVIEVTLRAAAHPMCMAWSILLRRFQRTLQERVPSHIIPHIPQVANTLQQVNGAFILFVPFEAPSPKSTCSKNTTDATKAFRANFASLT